MQAKSGLTYKTEIMKRLRLAKNIVEQILFAVESENDWKDIHTKTEMAIMQLSGANRLLAQYHLEICVIRKRKKMKATLTQKDINEIIKTYRYLD